MEGVQAYMEETDLSKRVQEWEDRIRPVLLMEVYLYVQCVIQQNLIYRPTMYVMPDNKEVV